jgi:DNA-binding response OmpR family regulator
MAAKRRLKKRIIILENDPDLADSIRVYLEDTYKVYIVQDPAHLLRYISDYKINALVTDLDTTHPDIHQHITKAKDINPNLKILVMYMFIDEDNRLAREILNEVDDYIFKPFDANVLKHKLDRLIQH